VTAIKIEYVDCQEEDCAKAKGDRRHAKRLNTAAGIRDSGALRPLKAAGPLPPPGHKSKEGSSRILRSRDGYTVNLSDDVCSLSLSLFFRDPFKGSRSAGEICTTRFLCSLCTHFNYRVAD
jgi:hypothetical protein